MQLRKSLLLVLLPFAAFPAHAHVASPLPSRLIDPVSLPVSGVPNGSSTHKMEVARFFPYDCPCCFDQQPLIEDRFLGKPVDVELRSLSARRISTQNLVIAGKYLLSSGQTGSRFEAVDLLGACPSN